MYKYFQLYLFYDTIELKVLSGIKEEITVKEFTSGEFAEVACIVLRFALVMCQPQFSSAKECCVSASLQTYVLYILT